jgi:hypothetical protein
MGVSGLELWVQDERNFFDAAKLYARMQGRAAGRSGEPATAQQDEASQTQPGREELKHASSLLEKGLEEMFLRESELAGKCASLRTKMEELRQALAKAQADLAREIESRAVAERNYLAERQARIAAEQRAERASVAQRSLEKQLVWQRQLERQIQAHLAGLNSLFLNKSTKGVAGTVSVKAPAEQYSMP